MLEPHPEPPRPAPPGHPHCRRSLHDHPSPTAVLASRCSDRSCASLASLAAPPCPAPPGSCACHRRRSCYMAWPPARPASSKLHEDRAPSFTAGPLPQTVLARVPQRPPCTWRVEVSERVWDCHASWSSGWVGASAGREGAGRGCWLLPRDVDRTTGWSFPPPASCRLRERHRGGTEEGEGTVRTEREERA